jgi:flagellar hook-basal body complex protein FliE
MAITPITPITSLEQTIRLSSILEEKNAEPRPNFSFADILGTMVGAVNETDAATKNDSFDLAMGFTDMQDLHTIEINAIRADLALRTMTSVRNKVLEAYSEIMRITI